MIHPLLRGYYSAPPHAKRSLSHFRRVSGAGNEPVAEQDCFNAKLSRSRHRPCHILLRGDKAVGLLGESSSGKLAQASRKKIS